MAFPTLPARPSVPLLVDPDAWLRTINGRAYARRVRDDGCVSVGEAVYYVGRPLGGQDVALRVDAAAGEFVVLHGGTAHQRLPIKGLQQCVLPFDTFVDQLAAQARMERPAVRATLG